MCASGSADEYRHAKIAFDEQYFRRYVSADGLRCGLHTDTRYAGKKLGLYMTLKGRIDQLLLARIVIFLPPASVNFGNASQPGGNLVAQIVIF